MNLDNTFQINVITNLIYGHSGKLSYVHLYVEPGGVQRNLDNELAFYTQLRNLSDESIACPGE